MTAPEVPPSLRTDLERDLIAGDWYPIHQLLTGSGQAAPAVCLLSAAELRATSDTISLVTRSSRATANLRTLPSATLVAWSEGLHYLDLTLRAHREREGAHGYTFDVTSVRTDDIGIEMRPLEYRMTDWLTAAERWDLTRALFEELASS